MRERRGPVVVRALLGLLLGLLVAGAALCASPSAARAQVFASELQARGFWPDIALVAGGGIGLGGDSLDTNVMAGARLGALYAYEPLIVNLGVSGQIGALAERGVGVELEVNHFGGPFLQFGFDRVLGGDFMTRATLGFALFGVQWQHRIDADAGAADNALMFVLRAPIGIWWFLLVDDARRTRRNASATASEPHHE